MDKANFHKGVRAARAWLNISRDELAKACNVNRNTIANIENGEHLKDSTIEMVAKYFWKQGVEITPDGGIRPHNSFITILEGDEGVKEFFLDVMEAAEQIGGEFLVCGMDEVKFYNLHQKLHISEMYRGKMDNMGEQVTYRVLVDEDQREILKPPYAVPYATYKTLPSDRISMDAPFYIYSDKLAIILDDITKILIIRDASLVDAYTRMFNTSWDSKFAEIVYTKA